LAAATLTFPLYMLIGAPVTLVSSGMSSIRARQLGARRVHVACAVFASAHGPVAAPNQTASTLTGVAGAVV
jgi:Na+-driven multidrug efflux pump